MRFEPAIGLTQCLTEPALFGQVFSGDSFWPWRVVSKLFDGLPLTEQREIELFRQCTGRSQLPPALTAPRLRRFIVLVGRRGGKDRFFSAVAVWRAALCTDWRRYLSAGEEAVVILLGKDKKQAAILRRYCDGLLRVPALAREVVRETRERIEFRNGAALEIASNDASLVRGRSAIEVIGSECAHWKHEETSASSDEEVVAAAEPSMAMCPDGGILLLGSSVHRQRGYMYRKWKELHGNDDADNVCWFAPSKVMNPLLPQSVIDAALASDPAKNKAEFLNVWRVDMSDFVPPDVVESVTDFGTYERPRQSGISYSAFADMASGVGSDSATLCICHRLNDDAGTVVIDVLRERPPRFVPSDVIREYSQLLKFYGVHEIYSDAYAGGYQDEWTRNQILFKPAEYSTSEAYLRALPMLLSQRVRFVDSPRLRQQLLALERSVSGGHDKIEHPHTANAHDDLAACVAGAMVVAGSGYGYDPTFAAWQPGFQDRDVAPTTVREPTAAEAASARAAEMLRAYCWQHGFWI
jgi:hypothetical protein